VIKPTIIFDLDGTIVDTAPDLVETLRRLLAQHGLGPISAGLARTHVGGGVKYLIQWALGEQRDSITHLDLAQLVTEFIDDYACHIADKSRLFPGFESALDELTGVECQFAVCTNKLEWLSVRLLSALGLLGRFSAICGQDTFGIAKPNPQFLLRTIELAGGSPDRSVMVGDSAPDIDTAKAADIPVIAVDFGYSNVPISCLAPDRVISHFDALPLAVRDLLKL
jgi:phosphoglycolate phosphatase